MDIILLFCIIVVLVFNIIKMLDYIYLFQVKEYRIDRFVAAVHDRGIVQILLSHGKLPAKTIRNTLIFCISLVLFAGTVFVLLSMPMLLYLFLFIYPLSGFVFVLVGLYATQIASEAKRAYIMQKAAYLLLQHNVITIGITGSYGKTTTKEYLYALLSRHFKVAKTEENQNTDVGVSLSILKNVKDDTRYFIAEMGAYRKGEISKIARLTNPVYGIITGIGNQHADLFGGKDAIIHAKKELIDSLPANGKAYVNSDNLDKNKIKKSVRAPIFFYSPHDSVSLAPYVENTDLITSDLIPCIALARDLGMKEDDIKKAVSSLAVKFKPSFRRGYNGSLVLCNTYNTSVEGAIHTAGILAKKNLFKKIMITRGIIELGVEKQISYEKILRALERLHVTLYTTDGDFKTPQIGDVRVFKNEQDLSRALFTSVDNKTVIAIEGRITRSFISSLLTP